MIKLESDDFAKIVAECIRELDAPEFISPLISFGALICAKAELETEKNETTDDNDEYEAGVSYKAGDWDIIISTTSHNKARLILKLKGLVVCDRVLDSLYKAYNYAFNALSI